MPEVPLEEGRNRFIFDRGKYAPKDQRVKYQAFMPAPNGKTSVYRTSQLGDAEIWGLSERYVEPKIGRKTKARGELKVVDVRVAELQVLSTAEPPRHANIVNWPDTEDAQLSIAQVLAERSRLYVRA